MNRRILAAGLIIFSGTAVAQMDHAIGGKRVDRYHESVFDPKQNLYLYSGGD